MADQLNETKTGNIFSKQDVQGVRISYFYVRVEINLLDLLLLAAGVEHYPFRHACLFVNEQLHLRILTSTNFFNDSRNIYNDSVFIMVPFNWTLSTLV